MQQINGLNSTVEAMSSELIEVRLQRDLSQQKNKELILKIDGLEEKIIYLQNHSFPLSFQDTVHILSDV